MVAPTPAAPIPPSPQKRLAYGGVSPKLRTPAIKGQQVLAAPKTQPKTSGLFSDTFLYNGGPVISCPQVYASFWGPNWVNDPAHLQTAGRLSQFHQDLIDSNFMNILTQYGVGIGRGSGAFIQASFVGNVATSVTDADIQSIIQAGISQGVWPDQPNTQVCLIIHLDETIGVNDPTMGLVLCEPTGDTAFGYHNFFTTTGGNPFYYAVIPALSDACLTESCPGDDLFCSLHLYESQLDRQTQVSSHEFAEMVTDPQLNAWFDPNNGECGDICNGETDYIIVGSNTWAVQPQYSKYDDETTSGTIYCTAQVNTPEPVLSGGPASRTTALAAARMQSMASYNKWLPLPTIHFDAKAKVASVDNQSVQDYVHKLFFPLRPANIMADFPGFLRKLADSVAAAKL